MIPKLLEIEVKPGLVKFLQELNWQWGGLWWKRYNTKVEDKLVARDLEAELKKRLREKLEWPTATLRFDDENELWYFPYSNNGFIKAGTEIGCWIQAAYSFELIGEE